MDTNELFNYGVNLMRTQAQDFTVLPLDPNWLTDITTPRKAAHPECQQCQSDDPMTPSHDGSRFCENGSIAAGGNKTHCTCDNCY